MPFLIISILIIIHELGHFLMAKIFKVEVYKIYLYPLGGISKFNMEQNISPYKEFLILISGPIFQIGAYLLLKIIMPSYINMITTYHYGILLFNLMPIYPLDGGKFLNLFLSNFLTFKLSYYTSICISIIIILIIFLTNFFSLNFNTIFIVVFLLLKVIKEYKNLDFLYQKFLLERYLHNYHFPDTKIINNINNFYRNKAHILNINNSYCWEKDFLHKIYKKC